MPPGLLFEAAKEYNIKLSKQQIEEIQTQADKSFKNYCDKIKNQGKQL